MLVALLFKSVTTVFIWLDAAPQIVAAHKGATINCENKCLKIVFQ